METVKPSETHDPYAALRQRDCRFFLGGFFASVVGAQIQTAAALYEVYQKTHTDMSLAWVGLALAIPMLLLTLPAGHFADRHSRKRIIMSMQIFSAVCAIALAILSQYFSHWEHSLAAMYVLLGLGNAGAVMGRPAREALLPLIVPGELFPNAVTWNSSAFETGAMLGPAIGGFVCVRSIPFAYVLTAGFSIISFFLLAVIPVDKTTHSGKTAGVKELIAGIKFVWKVQLIFGAMSLDLFAVLFGGAVFLLPHYAEVLQVGAFGYGWLRAAPSIGAITMAMVQAHSPRLKHAGRTMMIAVAGFGAATIVFGLSKNFWLSFVMLILTGAFDNISVVVRHSLIQLRTPNSMRGRVSAVNQIFIGSSNEVGGFESGLTARAFGLVPSVVFGGIGTLIVVIASAALFPNLRKLGYLHEITPAEPESLLS